MKVLILFLVFIIASGVGSKKVVTIVVYDKIKGYLNWLQDWFRQAALDNCNTKCILKEYDESTIKSANIVLFHAPTRDQSHPSFPAGAPQNAIYALLSMEQPKYARVLSDFEALKKFNVLLTYSLKSNYPGTNIPNLPITYFPLHILSPQVVLQPARPFIQKAGYNTGSL